MRNYFLLFLLIAPAVILTFDSGHLLSRAEEDDGEDEMVDVEGEETGVTDEGTEEEEAQDKPGGSPDADTTILFTRPSPPTGTTLELPGGDLVEFLVGFRNKGSQEFVLETLDASFRYPMDFNFYIQNFSTLAYERKVEPGQEATLSYSFVPAEAFAGRPFGLSINLRYRDLNGNQFYEGVYNETVNIIEIDEGLDGETFFLYVLLGACVVLLLVVGQQFLYSVGKKRVGGGTTAKKQIETGTSNHNDVDYEWLPKETLQSLKNGTFNSKHSKSKKRKHKKKEVNQERDVDVNAEKQNKSQRVRTSPKTSPRARKSKRTAGSDD